MGTFLKNNRWSILWGLFIFLLTMMPGQAFPRIPTWIDQFHPDKVVHLFIFAVFTFLLISGFSKEGNPGFVRSYAILITLVISLGIGGATELLQGWLIPGRTADWKDFLADTVGTMAVIIALLSHRFLSSGDVSS